MVTITSQNDETVMHDFAVNFKQQLWIGLHSVQVNFRERILFCFASLRVHSSLQHF